MNAFPQFGGRRILVTGGTGFIGRHLLHRLSKMNARLHAVSRRPHLCSDATIQWHQANLNDQAATTALVQSIKPDVIYHLASHVVGARSPDAIMPTFHSNLMTTVNLLIAAHQIGCQRFILAGSQEEPHGGNPEMVPCSPYAVAKWASSAYARMFHTLYGLPVVILRLFMVYGPGQPDLNKLIPYVIVSLLRRDVPTLMSGQRPIDWIYVKDVVEALLASVSSPDIENRTIDIGSGQLHTVRTVVERIVTLMGSDISPSFGARADRPLEQTRVADTHPARSLLQWTPQVSLDNGLEQTIAWYAHNFKQLQLR